MASDRRRFRAEDRCRLAGEAIAKAKKDRTEAIRYGVAAGLSERKIGELVGLSGPRINRLKKELPPLSVHEEMAEVAQDVAEQTAAEERSEPLRETARVFPEFGRCTCPNCRLRAAGGER